jgi:sec-independent protein translocase protein TatB
VFDIGFFELLIIAIVGLVVIGPERLPETVRAISLWIGRLKRSLRETRSEIEKQIGADDIRRQLHNENVMRSLEKTRQNIEEAVQAGTDATKDIAKDITQQSAYKEHEELPDHAHGEQADPDGQPDEQPAPTDKPSSQ